MRREGNGTAARGEWREREIALLSSFFLSSLVPIGHGGITLCPGVPVCLPARSPSPLGRPEASAGKAIESKSPIPSPTLPSFLPSFLVCFSRRRRRVVGSEDDFNRLFPSLRPNLAPLDRRLLGAARRCGSTPGAAERRTALGVSIHPRGAAGARGAEAVHSGWRCAPRLPPLLLHLSTLP